MKLSLKEAQKRMNENNGNLDLRGMQITALPEGLTVGGDLDLRDTPIIALPEELFVKGSLYLRNTPITALPEGLTVGGDLDLCGTSITALPEWLSVGGYLKLSHTQINAPAGFPKQALSHLSHFFDGILRVLLIPNVYSNGVDYIGPKFDNEWKVIGMDIGVYNSEVGEYCKMEFPVKKDFLDYFAKIMDIYLMEHPEKTDTCHADYAMLVEKFADFESYK